MKYIFISYKRAETTTPVAQAMFNKIKVNLSGHGFETPFFDRKSIEAGDPWREEIDNALDRATHFVALLSDEYWLSEQCQRELMGAVERWEDKGKPKLLFVLTEKMDPSALVIDPNARTGKVMRKFPGLENLSQINFLGPYNNAGRLDRLYCSNHEKLHDQLFDLIQDIKNID